MLLVAVVETTTLRIWRAHQTASGDVQHPHEDLGEAECEPDTLLHDLREMTFVMRFPQVCLSHPHKSWTRCRLTFF